METTTPATPIPAAAPIQQLHHYAYRARDAEETRHFYEDILGLPLYHIIQSDHVPSTGEYCPYTHFFFRLHDGSFIAFFDLGDDEAAECLVAGMADEDEATVNVWLAMVFDGGVDLPLVAGMFVEGCLEGS